MILIIGPAFSGKYEYAVKLCRQKHIMQEKVACEVQREAARVCELSTCNGTVSVEHSVLEQRLQELADGFRSYEIITISETGGGVVPIDPLQRQQREWQGRFAGILAQRAETVIRICCGLPQVLKGNCEEIRE